MTYAGPAVDSGRMDAHALGAAMMSMAQLIDASASLTLGAGVSVRTEIAADFKTGSFSFDVVTTAQLASAASQLLSTMTVHDLLRIIGIGGGGGLISLVLWLARRKIQSIAPAPNKQVTVIAEDGQAMNVSAETVMLFQNSTVNLHLNGVVEPLRAEGMTELRTGRLGEPQTVVPASQVDSFEPRPVEGETLQDKVSTEIVQVVGLKFLAGKKWQFRMADGTTFNSPIDPRFMGGVLKHDVVFGAGDALEVDLRTVVIRDPTGGLHAQRDIAKVIRHLPAPTQFPLELGVPSADASLAPPEPPKRLPPSK